jgi:hypothetical protein
MTCSFLDLSLSEDDLHFLLLKIDNVAKIHVYVADKVKYR